MGGEPREHPPGTEKPRRVPPRGLRYELVSCGLSGHELVGTDAAHVRDEDALFVRESGGLRWHRCLRCDSWLPQPIPEHPAREFPPERDEIELPLRGRPLRDKYVLRLIAIDRALHFVVLGVLAAAIFGFLGYRSQLRHEFFHVVSGIQGGVGGVTSTDEGGILGELSRAFSLRRSALYALGFVVAAYAVLEGVEAVGLWRRKRWAEYLTFVATTVLFAPEIYELTKRLSPLKILTILINVAVVVYLLVAKRLFGVRGGGRAEREEIEQDMGWEALERKLPAPHHATP
jgi:uncharacterized membrane protein (DUF2068 family)